MVLAGLCHLTATVSRTPDLQQILQDTMNLVLHQVARNQAGIIVFLLDKQTGEMAAVAHRNVPEDHPCLVQVMPGQCLCSLAAQTGEAIFSPHGCRDDRHVRRWTGMPPHQDLSLPLKARDRVLGVMHLCLTPHLEMTDGDYQLLRIAGGQLSLAIDNTQLAAAVKEQGEQLRGLSTRLAEAEEAARQRLARELHDRVGQNLYILSLNLHLAQNLLIPELSNRLASQLAESIALVHQTVGMVRNLMVELRPPLLDDFGLLAALRWYGAQFAHRRGIAVNLQGDELTPRLPISVELPLFRIAQEALTNVARHAQASQVTITAEVEGDRVRLVIADNGVGFDLSGPGRCEDSPHWGLMTMRERAAAVGGHCRIESRPGAGTRVVVEVPR